jgi:uncharacterized membrane protein YdjX (TVP38/TMEM64 family)
MSSRASSKSRKSTPRSSRIPSNPIKRPSSSPALKSSSSSSRKAKTSFKTQNTRRKSPILQENHGIFSTQQPNGAETGSTVSWHAPLTPLNYFPAEIKHGNNKLLLAVFLLAILAVILGFSQLPALNPTEREALKFPRSNADVLSFSNSFHSYKEQHFLAVLLIFMASYLFLQAFAIPGAIFLSILAGPLFGAVQGLLIVSISATLGSCCCYLLSSTIGRNLVENWAAGPLNEFRSRIQAHRHNLFFYLLFLRVSPLLPNVSINVGAPLLNIPLHLFAGATFLGLMPANYIHVTTGIQLQELGTSDSNDPNAWAKTAGKLVTLLALASLALLPTLCRNKLEKLDEKLEKTQEKQL